MSNEIWLDEYFQCLRQELEARQRVENSCANINQHGQKTNGQ
jgi:hypothetical protein